MTFVIIHDKDALCSVRRHLNLAYNWHTNLRESGFIAALKE